MITGETNEHMPDILSQSEYFTIGERILNLADSAKRTAESLVDPETSLEPVNNQTCNTAFFPQLGNILRWPQIIGRSVTNPPQLLVASHDRAVPLFDAALAFCKIYKILPPKVAHISQISGLNRLTIPKHVTLLEPNAINVEEIRSASEYLHNLGIEQVTAVRGSYYKEVCTGDIALDLKSSVHAEFMRNLATVYSQIKHDN